MIVRVARFEAGRGDLGLDRSEWVIEALRGVEGVTALYHCLAEDGSAVSVTVFQDADAADARWRRSRRRASGSASRCRRPTTRSCTRWSARWSGHEQRSARILAAALAGGGASIIPSPPWHYVGDFLVIEFWADPDAVAAVLPPRLTPFADDPGRCAALFVDWQSCSDSGEELLDPVRGQYKEFFIVANAMLGEEHVTTCPYIWVDRDFALIRGWIQGFPKKLGEVHMTRSFGLDCRAEGRIFAGTLSANGRLLAEGTVTP